MALYAQLALVNLSLVCFYSTASFLCFLVVHDALLVMSTLVVPIWRIVGPVTFTNLVLAIFSPPVFHETFNMFWRGKYTRFAISLTLPFCVLPARLYLTVFNFRHPYFLVPYRPLPLSLVARLRELSARDLAVSRSAVRRGCGVRSRADSVLSRLKNIDPRRNVPRFTETGRPQRALQPGDTRHWGGRVRQFDVSRNYPGVELVIKRMHGASAAKAVRIIRGRVARHNARFKPTSYELVKPHAHPIRSNLVAMSKVDAPALDELFQNPKIAGITVVLRRRNDYVKLRDKHGFTDAQFKAAMRKVCSRTKISMENMLFFGVRRGKFVFIPLLDLF